MAERVYDRRGRKNWEAGVRAAEDQKLTGRRTEERRAGDRRQGERRTASGTPDAADFVERRLEERRKGQRRQPSPAPLTVKDLLGARLGRVHTLPLNSTVREAVDFLATHRIGLAVISTEQGGLVGVLSERDVVRAVAVGGADGLYQPIETHMTRGVWACSPDDSPETVISLMSERRIRHLPVLADGQLVGMVSSTDVIDLMAKRINR